MSAQHQLKVWLTNQGFRSKHLRWEHTEDGIHKHVVFATTKNNYHLSFADDYLGLTVSSRVSRPGENWSRGNDLHDGDFSKETFDSVLRDVLSYELREVSREEGGPPWILEGPTN